jgi:HK97 family phage prohead protease
MTMDYDAYLERARAVNAPRQPKAPEPDPLPPKKTRVKYAGTATHYLQGYACLYEVIHHFRGGRDIFQRGAFTESLRSFNDVFYGVDHEYFKPCLGKEDDGSLLLEDSPVGLAFRLALQPEHLELLAGRDQVSVACVPQLTSIRSDGVRIIKQANLVEISSVYLGAMETTHAVVVDAKNIRPLEEDAKHGFACESAATAFMRALKRLQ